MTNYNEILPAYLFVTLLPCSGYANVEAYLDMKQEEWINAHCMLTNISEVLPDRWYRTISRRMAQKCER